MDRTLRHVLLGCFLAAIMSCYGGGGEAAQSIAGQEWSCSAEALRALELPDTSRLARRSAEWHPPDASEGMTAVGFYSDGDLQLLKTETFGETGKASIEYRFRNPDDFRITYVEERYRRPIHEGPVEVAEQNVEEFFICGGVAVAGGDRTRAVELKSHLEEVLSQLEGSAE